MLDEGVETDLTPSVVLITWAEILEAVVELPGLLGWAETGVMVALDKDWLAEGLASGSFVFGVWCLHNFDNWLLVLLVPGTVSKQKI